MSEFSASLGDLVGPCQIIFEVPDQLLNLGVLDLDVEL
jgi:hypothetical protein